MSTIMENLQEIIGYQFENTALLRHALTHRSASAENNERLEFLGDSVLSLIVSTKLFRNFSDADEGALTRSRARLVRQETLARIARQIDLGRFVVLGEGAARNGGAGRASILADVVEAIIGAVYLEAGVDVAIKVVERLLEKEFDMINPETLVKDSKTELQEQLQKQGLPLPRYEIQETRGEPHEREFLVECVLESSPTKYRGKGSSRQRAEQEAARLALRDLTE